MVNLIYEIIPSLGYEVTIESINFTNLNAQKIKGMKLKGTDLLNENEVLQRIHSKDEVDNIKINIEKINTIAGEKTITSLSFIVDIQGRLSFIFDADMDIPYEYKLICLNIQKKLDELIYDSNSIREGVRLIEENLKLPKTLHQNLREIQQYLYDTISDENIRIDIEKFFLAEYPLSHIQIKQEV
ncbi:hypothetical protein JOD25_003561 [Kurthia huakuii]|nr:hypothetical protein [Kurthia huakuii]MBM7701168.1 hypothetical protein [Kurthia huakuii]